MRQPEPFPVDAIQGLLRLLEYIDRRFEEMAEEVCTCPKERALALGREFDELLILREGFVNWTLRMLRMGAGSKIGANTTRH